MVQLIAREQSDSAEQIQLDTPKIPIELNFQFQDLAKPFASRTPYSFNFKLPATRTNLKFMSFYYDYNVTKGTFKATKRTSVDLYDSGVLVMSGIMQLLSATEEEYTVVVFEELAKLFEEIKDLSWEQLFITEAGTVDTDLDHFLTWDNIISSWSLTDITTGNVGNGVIVYPLADYGVSSATNAESAGTTSAGFMYDSDGYSLGTGALDPVNFKPAIRIQYLIKYIFEYAGFVYNSTFFDSADFQKIYMFLATETERVQSRATYGFKTGLTSALNIPTSQTGIYQTLNFNLETGNPFYDPDGLSTNGQFTAPFDGYYLLQTMLLVEVPNATSSESFNVNVRFAQNGNSYSGTNFVNTCDPSVVNVIQSQSYLQLSQGDVVEVECSTSNTFDATQITTNDGNLVSYFTLESSSISTTIVDVSSNFPDVTVDKWLKAIFEKFNLRMVTDRDSVGTIYVEPWNDWWDTGESKDWTNKVDADSITIEPTTKYQKKSIKFSDGEGEDFLNQYYQYHQKKVKGSFVYDNEDNDFATGESETSDIFQPLRLRKIYQNAENNTSSLVPNVLVPVFWNWAENDNIYLKEFVSCKPVLAYYNGLQSIGNGATFKYGTQNSAVYPYFSQNNSYGVTESTLSLYWGYGYPSNLNTPPINGYTKQQLFDVYWLRMMNELYAEDSRLMTAKFSLNAVDIYNLKFNDLLYIEGAYWKLISLKNFALDNEKLANAELIKVINAPNARISSDCQLEVATFGLNADGTVDFIDIETGLPADATPECCQLNGFIWSDLHNKCFHNPGNSHGGGGTNPIGSFEDVEPTGGYPNNPADVGVYNDIKVTPFNNNFISGGTYTAEFFARTTSQNSVSAYTTSGMMDLNVPDDTITYITYDITTVEVGGTSGTHGNAANFTARTALANTRTSATTACTLRTIGSPTIINNQSDGGTHGAISINTAQRSSGAAGTYSLQCSGKANVIEDWYIRATVQVVRIPDAEVVVGGDAYFNRIPNTQITLNLSPTQTLEFN
jgi:hypothetical protein